MSYEEDFLLSRSDKSDDVLKKMVTKYPVRFHITTPKNFECVSDCGGCCTNAYFFEKEYQKLPEKYHKSLHNIPLIGGGSIKHQLNTAEGKCVFCKVKGCAIHQYRPLRCRIFPYFFVLDEKKKAIIVYCASFSNWPALKVSPNPNVCGIICPGLGKGSNVEKKIKDQAKEYLFAILEEKKESIPFHFFKNTDFILDPKQMMLFSMCLSKGLIPYPDKHGEWHYEK